MWASHHIWHKNVLLLDFNNHNITLEHISGHYGLALFFSCMILLAAAVKSAQLPFSSWLPRAMEGPTPSSAIFYGSLAVHIGVLILLRASHFWSNLWEMQWLITLLGGFTFIMASMAAQVQSSIKGQIAYSSISQIGLIFIEVAWGLEMLALVHFAGNAFLRSYQLLVSPSSVTYLIREQFYKFVPPTHKNKKPSILLNTLFILSMKEWSLDSAMRMFWLRMKYFIARTNPVEAKMALYALMGLVGLAVWLRYQDSEPISYFWEQLIFALAWVIFSIRALAEVRNAKAAWLLASGSHLFFAISIAFNESVELMAVAMYLIGVGLATLLGYGALRRLRLLEKWKRITLEDYQGHCYEHQQINLAMLIAMLGVLVSPVTTAFIGLELLYGYIGTDQWALLLLATLGFFINNLAAIRVYAKVFLGPHVKTYHEVARRSA
jgi:NADH:ubiquinone oxidoreductase subunit 5 (subunit L)/multisubunit Na+/H+ antiporter MnhA subunit